MTNFDLQKITNNYPYSLLLLADPSFEMINQYLFNSDCYVGIGNDNETIAVLVLQKISENTIEIKNIAVSETHQKKGIGTKLIKQISEIAIEEDFTILRVGTGNSSIAQLVFYQRLGFEMIGVQQNYFVENYDTAIIENGILCKHLVILEKSLLQP